MVNEHASRDADWSSDRRPGKKARLSTEHPGNSPPSYAAGPGGGNGGSGYRGGRPSLGGPSDRDYDGPRPYDGPPARSPPRPYDGPPARSPPHPYDGPPARSPPRPSSPFPTSARLLLANLSYSTTEAELADLFRDAGAEVDRVRLVKVTPGNRVNGNAYVWLRDARSVDIALALDGRGFLGRTLRVSDMPEDQRTACVRGLRPRSTAEDVHDLFHGCKILGVRCRPVKGGPPDMNTWFVDFADEDSFSRALAKDRTAPGLMICIATAQGRGPRVSRDKIGAPPIRDDFDRGAPPPPPPPRDEYDRRDDYDRKPAPEIEHERLPPHKERNGMGNGGPPPRGRSRSRSRSPAPPRGYDSRERGGSASRDRRDPPVDRDYDRRRVDYDRGDRGYPSRVHDRERRLSPLREERYRDMEHDRARDRDVDRRRSYRRDEPWADRDRDYRRDRDRDIDREHDRDYRRMDSRGGRHDRDYRDQRHAERRDTRGDHVLDPAVTAVLTNLPFCENREHVVDTLGRTLEDLPDGLKIQEIIPVGRRCGACIVVFRDPESQNRAVLLQSISITNRKVNILPLEVPSIARVQKLAPGYSVNDILEDMQRHYGVETLFVKMKQPDQLLLGVEDSRFLVRLLDIDGRPLLSARYATVSYIPSRHHSDSMAGRSRPPRDDFDDANGRGGSYRDRDSRDDRGSPGKDRRPSGDMAPGDRRDAGDEPRRGGDSRAYHHNEGEWKLRLVGLPVDLDDKQLLAIFENSGVSGVAFDRLDARSGIVCGGDTSESDMEQITNLVNNKESSPLKNTDAKATVISHYRKRALPDQGIDDSDKVEQSPSKKFKTSTDGEWKGKDEMTTLNPTREIHISPMTPSPGDYTLPPKVKKQPLDPMLPDTCSRLERLRSAILDRPEDDDSSENYEDFCKSLPELREPQTLVHTMSNTIDPIPPLVWSGNVKKGPMSHCNGFLVLNSNQTEEAVRKTVGELPKVIKIEHRGKWEDETFAHLLKPESVVIILKAGDDSEKSDRHLEKDGKVMPKSKAVLNGILRSLRGKQKMGISRYTLPGKTKKYVALCIPPNPCIFEKMRVPWRFRDYAGHDSLLLVVGPKNPEP